MTRRRSWSRETPEPLSPRDASLDGPELVVVRCAGRRVVAVMEDADGLDRIRYLEQPGEQVTARGWLVDPQLGVTSQDWGPPPPAPCPNHRAGHRLDGGRLATYVAEARRTGRRRNVDVRRVVIGDDTG